jgi:hypothetical protein
LSDLPAFDNGRFSEIGLQRSFDTDVAAMQIRIEIKGKDEFWERAFHVEWEDQFPDRTLKRKDAGQFIAQSEWLDDLERVGAQTLCRIVRAPENPQRRRWMNSLIPRRSGL